MLPALLAVAYLLLVSLGLGYLGERWILRVPPRPLTALLTGLIGATAALSWLSLQFPLCQWMHAGVAAVGLFGATLSLADPTFRPSWPGKASLHTSEQRTNERRATIPPSHKQRPPGIGCLALAMAALLITYLSAGPPQVYDTGFYHAQAVRWINEYPAIPGLANLHGRLAFNSAWFVWAALWDHGPLDGKSYHAVNAAFWLLGAALCFQGLARIGTGRPSHLVQASLLVPLCRFQHYAASLSPELPVHVLLVYAFTLLLRVGEEWGEEAKAGDTLRRLLLLAPFLPTLKLSMAPALLLIPAALWLYQRRVGWAKMRVHLAPALLLGAFVLGPFLARNGLLSGYLLYPFEKLDLFLVDWKVPAAEVERMRLEVRGWAIQPWIGPEAALWPVSEWLPTWLRRNGVAHPVEMALLAGAPVLFLAALVHFARRKEWERLLPCLLPVAGLLFWFTSAPDVRFGFSWLWLAVAIPVTLLLRHHPVTRHHARPIASPGRPILLVAALAWIAVGTVRWSGAHPFLALSPLPVVEMRAHPLPGGLRVAVPASGDRAWNAPLPNTPLVNPRLRLRGATLRAGFRQEGG